MQLIPQPHGGALRAHPPSGGGSSFKAAKKAALELLRDITPEAAQKLRDLVSSPDDRVAFMAVTQVLDRTLGKAGDLPQGIDETGGMDLSHLTPDQMRQFREHYAAMVALAAQKPPIDGDGP